MVKHGAKGTAHKEPETQTSDLLKDGEIVDQALQSHLRVTVRNNSTRLRRI
jgi:hypothetical protein